jgi:membrane protease YdiL (CAAX protease family)
VHAVLILTTAIVLGFYRVWRLRVRGRAIWAALGLSLDWRSVRDAGGGALIAAVSLFVIFVIEWYSRMLTVEEVGPVGNLGIDWLTPLVTGFTEEFVFRSAILGALVLCTNVPLAITLSATLFGVAHLHNTHASLLSGVGNSLDGVIYGIAFVKSGRVWLPFGLHAGWNWAGGRLLGFAVSGGHVWGPFVVQHDNGPALWTGGAYGPEGGMLGMVARIIMIGLLLVWLRVRTREHVEGMGGGPTRR